MKRKYKKKREIACCNTIVLPERKLNKREILKEKREKDYVNVNRLFGFVVKAKEKKKKKFEAIK